MKLLYVTEIDNSTRVSRIFWNSSFFSVSENSSEEERKKSRKSSVDRDVRILPKLFRKEAKKSNLSIFDIRLKSRRQLARGGISCLLIPKLEFESSPRRGVSKTSEISPSKLLQDQSQKIQRRDHLEMKLDNVSFLQ